MEETMNKDLEHVLSVELENIDSEEGIRALQRKVNEYIDAWVEEVL